MKTSAELMKSLQDAMEAIEREPASSAADVELAMAKALHAFLAEGHALTDLAWFKETTLYTGGKAHLKAA